MNLNISFKGKWHALLHRQAVVSNTSLKYCNSFFRYPKFSPTCHKWEISYISQTLTAHWEVVWTYWCQLWVLCTGGESNCERKSESHNPDWNRLVATKDSSLLLRLENLCLSCDWLSSHVTVEHLCKQAAVKTSFRSLKHFLGDIMFTVGITIRFLSN